MTNDEVKVRVGIPEDLDECMKLFELANDENALTAMDPVKLLNTVWPSLHREGGIVGVIGKPAEAVVLLRVEQLWYSDEPVLCEKLVFVASEYRSAKGGRAAKLCEFAKKTSDELGMPLVIGIMSNDRTKAKIRTYERLIGPQAGAFFIYGAKTGHAVERN
jgi:hypothetical protein